MVFSLIFDTCYNNFSSSTYIYTVTSFKYYNKGTKLSFNNYKTYSWVIFIVENNQFGGVFKAGASLIIGSERLTL